ncbi:C2 domain-containing protein [Mycena indigotica]|uniref:C2 domain-containing protein n=1 Tax=Mycena indigotica TaxID=2126181 RepID=A0A8H6TC60_9AGAR|nr:C2 domain-containing protein [Mycena indigotica]KAF7314993.1 C2 domain-containing protein [Mycena indigotica]
MRSRRQPLSMSRIIESIGNAVHHARDNAHDLAAVTKSLAEEHLLDIPYVDLTIQFIGASGIPKVDVVGSADPYFVAKLDNRISFVSTVKVNTLKPVWNEIWRVKNVPAHASLSVEVLDKDDGAKADDFIGKFTTSVTAGAKEAEIEGPLLRKAGGTFWLKIESTKSNTEDPKASPYTFDGPIRFSRHFSPTVGFLTNSTSDDRARLYSTWKMYIKGVQLFFGDTVQQWNHGYKAAQNIFGPGPSSMAVRSGIMGGHRLLYARATTNQFGVIEAGHEILGLLRGGTRVKPAVYTYIISAEDDSLRFSETGAAFFVDFASKHALHANCHPCVRYSGEFHPRPAGGWAAFRESTNDGDVEWELVVDNNSGTYSPDKTLLPTLKALLEYNFTGMRVYALDREDPELVQSREACRAYALQHRGIRKEDLQPQRHGEEETLAHRANTISGAQLENYMA